MDLIHSLYTLAEDVMIRGAKIQHQASSMGSMDLHMKHGGEQGDEKLQRGMHGLVGERCESRVKFQLERGATGWCSRGSSKQREKIG